MLLSERLKVAAVEIHLFARPYECCLVGSLEILSISQYYECKDHICGLGKTGFANLLFKNERGARVILGLFSFGEYAADASFMFDVVQE